MDVIRQILDTCGRLPVKAQTISPNADLYNLGLTSFAAVQVMMAIEEAFSIEFPERMLNRRSFSSIASIAACVEELAPTAVAS